MSTVGIVGLGLLDHAVASRLIKAGHAVVGFDVLPDRAAAVAAMGGKTARSAAAVAQSAEAVCTLLPSLAAAETAVLGPAAAEALTLARKAGLDLELALDVLNSSAATSAMLKVRGPMIIHGEFPAQMKLDLFMKDIHLMQEAAAGVEAPLPFTDLAERLYAAAQAAGHGADDLAVVVTALGGSTARQQKARRSAESSRRTAKSSPMSRGRRRPDTGDVENERTRLKPGQPQEI